MTKMETYSAHKSELIRIAKFEKEHDVQLMRIQKALQKIKENI